MNKISFNDCELELIEKSLEMFVGGCLSENNIIGGTVISAIMDKLVQLREVVPPVVDTVIK